MPAIVAEILVKVGDTVKAGQELLILECMKVQRPIVSSTPGIVQAIKVELGQAVESGTTLLELTPA
jgi:biotin carboxyl carrier protein